MSGSEQEIAFQEVKAKLTAKPVLKLYNPKASKTKLHTQVDGEKDALKLVYAIRRCTTDTESKYHSSRLELMAIAWALKRLRPYWYSICRCY